MRINKQDQKIIMGCLIATAFTFSVIVLREMFKPKPKPPSKKTSEGNENSEVNENSKGNETLEIKATKDDDDDDGDDDGDGDDDEDDDGDDDEDDKILNIVQLKDAHKTR